MKLNFDRQSRRFRVLLRESSRSLTADNVHDLRVCLRRLRAALWVLKKNRASPKVSKLDKHLHALLRKFGSLRETQVAQRDAASYRISHRSFHSQIEKKKKALRKILKSSSRKKIELRLEEFKKSLHKRGSTPQKEALKKILGRLHPWQQRKLKPRDLHPLRILIKKTRYTLESLGKELEPLELLQDDLGKVHDLEVLREHVGRYPRLAEDERKASRKAISSVQPAIEFAINRIEQMLASQESS